MNCNSFSRFGKLKQFDTRTKKHSRQNWKVTAGLLWKKDDLCEYMSWYVQKRYNLNLVSPLRGSHVTLINDRIEDSNCNLDSEIRKLSNEKIEIDISLVPMTNGEHWWLPVTSPQGHMIRHLCGFDPVPFFPFHLTIGYVNPKQKEHGEYIYRQIQRYGS